MQLGYVPATNTDVSDLIKEYDYKPTTKIHEGVANFVKWYRLYYNR